MTVCFEFLNREPLDNMVTFLNYRFDKVIFFGVTRAIKKAEKTADSFLKKYCDVKETEFIPLPSDNLNEIMILMESSITKEIDESNDIYFDITGGENMMLVAFGILSERYDTPIHKYDVIRNECIDLKPDSSRHITRDIPARRVELTIEKYIEMRGGTVNYRRQKNNKNPDSEDFKENTGKIWKIARRHYTSWNQFSEFFRNNFHPDDELWICENADEIKRALDKAPGKLKENHELYHILNEMFQSRIITDYKKTDTEYKFRLKNDFVKDCLWDSGSILELHMCQLLKTNSDYCGVGIHLDWDGVIEESRNKDVLNEIDVLSIKGNIATFVSCKMGSAGREALYELDTVARRFGGKYARKMLAVAQNVSEVDGLRAKEMRIKVYKV